MSRLIRGGVDLHSAVVAGRQLMAAALLFCAGGWSGLSAALTLTPDEIQMRAGTTIELRASGASGALVWLATYGTIEPSSDGTTARYTAPFEPGLIDVAVSDGTGVAAGLINVTELATTPTLLTIPGGRVRLVAGDAHPLSVTARYSDGRDEEYTDRVEWRSENPEVARVETDGVVVALAAGEGAVVASAGGLTARIGLVVEPRVGRLLVTPNPLLLTVGERGRLAVERETSRGERLSESVATSCTQSVEPEGIARVEADGSLVGVAQGQGEITLRCDGDEAALPLFVTPDGQLDVRPARLLVEAGGMSGPLQPSGGSPPYVAVTDGGEVSESGGLFRVNAPGEAGSYRVWISDDLGERVEVTMEVVAPLRVSPAVVDLKREGSANLAVVGGIEPLQWRALRGTLTPFEEGGARYQAPAVSGYDEITVVDARGHRETVAVNVEGGLVTSPRVMVLEPGQADGFRVVGGTQPYSIVASAGTYGRDGELFTYRAPDVAGQYTIEVKDDLGRLEVIDVNVRSALRLSPGELFLGPAEEATIDISGGFGERVVTARTGEVTLVDSTISYRAAEVNNVDLVTVTDQEGSIVQMLVQVSANGLYVSPARGFVLPGESQPLRALGGTPPYSWQIEGSGDLDQTAGELITFTAGETTGRVVATVTDAAGLVTQAEVEVFRGALKASPELAVLRPRESITLSALFGLPDYLWSARRGTLSATEGSEVVYTPPRVALGEDLVTVEDSVGQRTAVRLIFSREDEGDVLAIYSEEDGRVGGQMAGQAIADYFSGSGWLGRHELYRVLEAFDPVVE